MLCFNLVTIARRLLSVSEAGSCAVDLERETRKCIDKVGVLEVGILLLRTSEKNCAMY